MYGQIQGEGLTAQTTNSNLQINHLGSTSGGYSVWNKCEGVPSHNTGFTYSFLPSQQPNAYFNSFGKTVSIPAGKFNNTNTSCGASPFNTSTSGSDMNTENLLIALKFGLDISGENAAAISHPSRCASSGIVRGGQGGAGLYILAKYVIFEGVINLSGGNGTQKDICDYNSYSASWVVTGGGGGGSLVLRTTKVISSSGSFVSSGGNRGGGSLDYGIKGGNGKMIILNN